MKKISKLVTVGVLMMLVLSLLGCSSKKEEESQAAPEAKAVEEVAETEEVAEEASPEDAFIGDWYEYDFAYAATPDDRKSSETVSPNDTNAITLNEDFTYKATYYKEAYEGTWALEDDMVVLDFGKTSLNITAKDDTLEAISVKTENGEEIWHFIYKRVE